MKENKKRKPDLNRLLKRKRVYAPPFEYFASVSMTLLSIVQGIAFTGMISSAISALAQQADLKLIEYILAGCFILGLWHRYVQHHQFAGWQISIKDTLLLFAFGVVEGIMIAALDGRLPIIYVNIGITLGFLVGTIAYGHASQRLRDFYIEDVYREHYEELFDDIYPSILGYEIKMRDVTMRFTGIFALVVLIDLWRPAFGSWFSLANILIFAIYLWYWDLNVWLFDELKWKQLGEFGLQAINPRTQNDSVSFDTATPSSSAPESPKPLPSPRTES